jgi:hypothetical protein
VEELVVLTLRALLMLCACLMATDQMIKDAKRVAMDKNVKKVDIMKVRAPMMLPLKAEASNRRQYSRVSRMNNEVKSKK